MNVKKYVGTYRAKTPISHGSDEDFGMEQRLRTIEMVVEEDGNKIHEDIPVISGNSMRGCLRDFLAEHLLDQLGVEVHDRLSYSLYSGGTLERGTGTPAIRRRMIEDIRSNIPMLSLLGTAIGSQLISGKLKMGMLIPISKETQSYTGIESEKSIFEYVGDTFYTRKDDLEGETDRDEDEQAQQMKYNVEILVSGTEFYHWMDLHSPTKLEISCLGKAFELFKDRPFIGGMSAKGHGKVDFKYDPELPSGDVYEDFLDDNKENIKDFLKNLDEELEG